MAQRRDIGAKHAAADIGQPRRPRHPRHTQKPRLQHAEPGPPHTLPARHGPHTRGPLVVHHPRRAAHAEERGDDYNLTPEQCAELQKEGVQYYHRYLSLFQIDDFEGVIRDTQRNLDLFSFVDDHTERDDLVWSFQQFRPYVLMMNTRAKVSVLLADGQFADAIRGIEAGRERIREFFQQSSFPEMEARSSEIAFPAEWLEEVRGNRPPSNREFEERAGKGPGAGSAP